MADKEYTPGPWVFGDESRTSITTQSCDLILAHISVEPLCQLTEEDNANGFLMAASPLMFEALEAVFTDDDSGGVLNYSAVPLIKEALRMCSTAVQ